MSAESLDSVGAYVINLDRSVERLASAATQFEAVGLAWTRIPAVDGNGLPDATPGFDAALFLRNTGRAASKSEVALYLSHFKALAVFLGSGNEFALIFEDDFLIENPGGFRALTGGLVRHAGRWDIVKLSGSHRYAGPIRRTRVSERHDICMPLFKSPGACCYMVNRTAAQRILAGLASYDDHFDHRLDHPWLFNCRYRILQPFAVREAAFAHTINYASRASRLPLAKRASVLRYRIGIGLRRLAFNAGQLLR